MDRLDMMRCFVAVADHGSFAAAARKLGLSTSALTRHVAGLEDDLSAQLMRRTTRAVSLTDEGSRFLDRARGLLADFDEAKTDLEGNEKDLVGRLVVTAPITFGRIHVAPLLARFARLHPRLEVDLQVSDRFESLVEDGIDVAFRIGHLSDSTDIAAKVGAVRRVLVAAPQYLAEAPVLRQPNDLFSHRLIGFRAMTPAGQWGFFSKTGPVTIRPSTVFSTNSADIAIAHACGGGGMTLALSYQVFDHLQSGALVRQLTDCEPTPMPVSFVTSGNRRMPARLRLLLDLIRRSVDWDFALETGG